MHILLRILSLCAFGAAIAFWAAGSKHITEIYPYVYEEPHVNAAVFEATARGELLTRCSTNYAIGTSTCSSYGAVLDSLPLRLASAFTGRPATTAYPEWVDPYLQWLLAVKHGLVTAGLLALACWLTAPVVGPWYALLLFLLASGHEAFCQFAFFVRPDGEMAAAIFLLSTLAWRQIVHAPIRRLWPGVIAGLLAPIKLPVVPFAVLALRSWRARVAFLAVAGFLMVGLAQSSYELTSFLRNAFLSASLGAEKGYLHVGPQTLGEALAYNLRIVTDGQFWLLTLILPGWLFSLRAAWHNHGRRNLIFFAALTLLVLLPLKTRNGQERFLLGFTLVFYSWAVYGISRFLPRWGWALVLPAMLLTAHHQWSQWPANRLSFPPEARTSANEQKLLQLLRTEKGDIYLDERLHFQLNQAPLREHRTRIKLVDPLSGSLVLPEGALLVTVCYPTDQAPLFGISSFGAIRNAVREQCKETLHPEYLSLAHSRFRPDHPLASLVLVRTTKKAEPVKPAVIKGSSLSFAASFFRLSGLWIRPYEAQLVTQAPFPGKAPPELRKTAYFAEKGRYVISPEVHSRFRSDESKLTLLLDGVEQSSCSLGTLRELPYPPWLPGILQRPYARWRALFVPKRCELGFSVARAGAHELGLRVEGEERLGQARFFQILLKKEPR